MGYSSWLMVIALLFPAINFYRRYWQKKPKDKEGILLWALFYLFLGLSAICDNSANYRYRYFAGGIFTILGFVEIIQFLRGKNEDGKF